MADRYLQEDGVSFYQLEGVGVTDVYLLEGAATTAAAALPLWVIGDLSGMGASGRFFKDRLDHG